MVLLVVEPPDQNICHVVGHDIRCFIDAHPNWFVSRTVLNLVNGILVALTQILLLKGGSVWHGVPMFDFKSLRNLVMSNFIHGMLVARKASQSSFSTIAVLDFFGFVAKQSSSCVWVTFLFRFNWRFFSCVLDPTCCPI